MPPPTTPNAGPNAGPNVGPNATPATSVATSLNALRQTVIPVAEAAPPGLIPSAVLMPLIGMQAGAMGIILTERAADLRHHAGQISFPGGRIEAGESPTEAALREAEEEIGLDPAGVDILGHLPGVATIAGFHIAPVLAYVRGAFTPVAATGEVARVLIEPLAPLIEPGRHVSFMRETEEGRRYQSWQITHGSENIWGATARILVQWSLLLDAESIKGSLLLEAESVEDKDETEG